ncbi:hypothetical protein BZA77DRAFT_134892 [Pyronema omphalodes]|nr:hypothetical protein BZA77DRAFT_134892 [Pyronema omphalodes]
MNDLFSMLPNKCHRHSVICSYRHIQKSFIGSHHEDFKQEAFFRSLGSLRINSAPASSQYHLVTSPPLNIVACGTTACRHGEWRRRKKRKRTITHPNISRLVMEKQPFYGLVRSLSLVTMSWCPNYPASTARGRRSRGSVHTDRHIQKSFIARNRGYPACYSFLRRLAHTDVSRSPDSLISRHHEDFSIKQELYN